MQPIELNDLPKWSPWPARLLGAAPWKPKVRSTEDTGREYNKDKYGSALEYYLATGATKTPEEVNAWENSRDPAAPMCVAAGQTLYGTTASEGVRRHYDIIRDTVRQALGSSQTVVELGCGYGFNLWRLKPYAEGRELAGGDFAENAVRLAASLYSRDPDVSVCHFDFYDEDSYRFLGRLAPPLAIFTCYALELLPATGRVFDILSRYAHAIETVMHFEPVYQFHESDTLLEVMRRRYIEVNDYNRDFFALLQSRSDVCLSRVTPSVYGVNPLNPMAIIEWSFQR
jgi:hypothetical protein